jgi:hypothetical protein
MRARFINNSRWGSEIVKEKKNYFNNTKVANCMSRFVDLTQDIYVSEFGKGKSNIPSKVCFEANELSDLQSKISRFDLMVMDAAYTILVNGGGKFSLEMLANVMVGKEVSFDKKTSTKLNEIQKSINKLKRIYINIDYTDLMIEKGKIKPGDKFIVNGSLMPVKTYYITSHVKHQTKVVYEIIQKPVLYEYAENLSRVISVPSHILAIPGVREDNDFIAIKQELIKEIELMRSGNNNYRSREITYEWEHGERSGGFAARVGLNKENYANDKQWNKRKVKLTEQIRTVLDHLVEIQFIKGYSFTKKGKSVVGVSIEL